jgi:hypothetical protein
MIALPDELQALKKFHGHLGPYAVLGYRMGLAARQRFPNRIYAVVHSGTKRPLSCLADGVQMSSCCTLGKNNISVREDDEARVEFSDGNAHIEFSTLPSIRQQIDGKCTHENEEAMSLELFTQPMEKLFTFTEGRSAPFGK